MNKIFEKFHDPEWWFSVVGVALIIGVFSSYIKDLLGAGFSRLSRTFKAYRDRKIKEESLEIDRLAENPTLLVLAYIRLVFLGLLFLLSVGFYLFVPVWALLVHHFPDAQVLPSLYNLSSEFKYLVARWSVVPYGVLMCYLEFKLMNWFRICQRARKKFEKKF